MHIGAAQVFDRHVLAGRRFHQRRTAEEDRAGAPDDDVVLAQCRHVGAARRAVTEHDRDLRDAQFGKDGLIAENASGQIPVREDLRLKRQEAARAVAQVHDRQPVLDRDVEGPDNLFHRQRIPGAALHAGVVGVDDDFPPVDDADAADDAGTGNLPAIFGIGGKRRQFEERRAGIEQQFDAVAHEHFVLARQTLEVARRPLAPGGAVALPERIREAAIVRAVAPELLGRGVNSGLDPPHGQAPACGASDRSGAPR